MPEKKLHEFNYVFTITFKSMRVSKKFRLINNLNRYINEMFLFTRRRPNINLMFSVEYHFNNEFKNKKPKNIDELKQYNNIYAPHLHGVISSDVYLSETFIENLRQVFLRNYGRTQLFFQENPQEVISWLGYSQKNVSNNDLLYPGYGHFKYFENVLENVEYINPDENIIEEDEI